MSSFFGIYNRIEKSITDFEIQQLRDATSFWGPDDEGIWKNKSVVLGHNMLWNIAESKLEKLPNKNGSCVITMDARLDNREEVAEKLDMLNQPLEHITDSDIILASYRKWGEDCTKYLLGDFSFAIWDENKQQLFCARDHIGIKSFYYYLDDEVFVFSNDIRGVLVHQNVPKEFNDLKVLYYLQDEYHPSMTFSKSIRKLPPASTLVVSKKTYEENTYWRAEDSPKIEFSSIDDYAYKLRELIEEAVATRSRSIYPIASHLSGGLDSSTIAVLANRILKTKNRQLHTYNWVASPEAMDDPNYYEWNNSRRIAESEQMAHYYVELNEDIAGDLYLAKNIITDDTECIEYEKIARKKAKSHNVRTMLSGWGGDELITYNGRAYYTELFWMRNPIYAIYKLYKEERGTKRKWLRFLKLCYSQFLIPVVGKFRNKKYFDNNYLYCLQSDFMHFARSKHIDKKFLSQFSSHQNQLDLFNLGHIVNRIESWSSSSFADKMEYSYPLLDKRIVEFALGIPSGLYRMNGYGRYLFRYSVAGILSDQIRWNKVKSEPNRVSLLLDMTLLAKVKLVGKMKKDRNENKYIDFDKLYDLVSTTHLHWKEKTLKDKIEALDLIHKSMMIYQIKHDII